MYDHRDDIKPERPPRVPNRRLRRGLTVGVVGTVLVALIALFAGIVLNGGGAEHVSAASLPVTTTETETTPPPAVASQTATTGAPAGAAIAVTTAPPTPSPSTTAPPVKAASAPPTCRNSFDPRCGPFRWSPPPGTNEPLTVTVAPQSQQANVGQTVNFDVMAKDPDARIDKSCIVIDWGDGHTDTGGPCPPPLACRAPAGPWTPPAKVPDDDKHHFSHTYTSPTQPGRPFIASFRYRSQPSCDPNPYGGVATASGSIAVIAAS